MQNDITPTRIAERVVEAILAQKLAPGERLGEQALAENFGVSRTMVREALMQLQARGFVEVQARRGWYVEQPSAEEARDAFAARQVDKRYMAVVWGTPVVSTAATHDDHMASMPSDGETWHLIDQAIAADWERRPLRVVDAATGKPSQTWWRAVTAAEASALPTPPRRRTRLSKPP